MFLGFYRRMALFEEKMGCCVCRTSHKSGNIPIDAERKGLLGLYSNITSEDATYQAEMEAQLLPFHITNLHLLHSLEIGIEHICVFDLSDYALPVCDISDICTSGL